MTMELPEKVVGIGKIDVCYNDKILVSIGLGSCVGVSLFDRRNAVAGMAHVMLPSSKESTIEEPNRSVLLSEHHPDIRRQLRSILEAHDFSIVEEADESFETIRKYNGLTTGLVLLSRYLPQLQGIETLKRIREKDRESKVILISNEADKISIANLLSAGADEVIISPFDDEKVVEVTKSVIYVKQLRFADVAIPILIYKMINRGADINNLTAKIAGGANIFSNIQLKELGMIGQRNVEAVKEQLRRYHVRIIGEDTGSNCGRTIRFNPLNGEMRVKTIQKEYMI